MGEEVLPFPARRGATAIRPRGHVCQTGAEGEASRETDQEEDFSYVPVGVRAEKSRWLAHLATLLTGTDTPLGRRFVEKPTACNSMGLGLRSGTLRNRVHALRPYFTWLASSHRVPFPSVTEHVLDYLELKVQEPCTRVSLKVVHHLVYLEEISGISPEARLTVRPRYSNLLAELLSQTKPVLEAIERTVVDYLEPVFIRLYAWFYLLQTCGLMTTGV